MSISVDSQSTDYPANLTSLAARVRLFVQLHAMDVYVVSTLPKRRATHLTILPDGPSIRETISNSSLRVEIVVTTP